MALRWRLTLIGERAQQLVQGGRLRRRLTQALGLTWKRAKTAATGTRDAGFNGRVISKPRMTDSKSSLAAARFKWSIPTTFHALTHLRLLGLHAQFIQASPALRAGSGLPCTST